MYTDKPETAMMHIQKLPLYFRIITLPQRSQLYLELLNLYATSDLRNNPEIMSFESSLVAGLHIFQKKVNRIIIYKTCEGIDHTICNNGNSK